MGIFEKLQHKLELYRLEQRYTRRDKRTTFTSDAVYVDGEYVSSPMSPTRHSNSTSNSTSTSTSSSSRRWSKMPAVAIKELGRSTPGRV